VYFLPAVGLEKVIKIRRFSNGTAISSHSLQRLPPTTPFLYQFYDYDTVNEKFIHYLFFKRALINIFLERKFKKGV
jgi:hypothetical protein